jgi:hypothetical protein
MVKTNITARFPIMNLVRYHFLAIGIIYIVNKTNKTNKTVKHEFHRYLYEFI